MGRRVHNLQKMGTVFLSFSLIFFFASMSLQGSSVKSKRAFLGVSVQELTPSLKEAMDLGDHSGLLVSSVVQGSPADKAGIQEEDVIVKFDGKTIEIAKKFAEVVGKTEPGKTVEVVVLRAGKTKNLQVELVGKQQERKFAFAGEPGLNNFLFIGERPKLGVEYQDLDARELAAYFKVEQRSGVLVVKVTKNSAADKAGVLPGDVIVALSDEKVNDGDDLIQTLSDFEGGDEVNLTVVRQGKKMSLKVTLNENGPQRKMMRWHDKTGPSNELHWNFHDNDDVFIPRSKGDKKIYKYKKGNDKEKNIEIIVEDDDSI